MNLVSKLKQIVKPAARPRFSLCHATARMPDGWVEAMEAWTSRADHPEQCEYVLCVDKADVAAFRAFTPEKIIEGPLVQSRLVVNEGRQCAVDGWNSACAAATGEVIITVADDWFPPEHWDTLLWDLLMKNGGNVDYLPHYTQRAVWVATGVNDKLMTFSILTRAYYQRYGYVFYPEYIGMYADNDFQKQCERDGVLIDARQILPVFEHRHPSAGTAEVDDIYRRQNRSEAYEVGRKLFESRWPDKGGITNWAELPKIGALAPKQSVAVCLPGEVFSKHVMRSWTQTLAFLLMKRNMIVTPVWGHCSNVYVSRQAMANSVCDLPFKHDFVLWVDDDQVVEPQHVQWLFETLEKYPGVDVVSGWTYIQDEETGVTKISAGKYNEDGSSVLCIPIPEMHRVAATGDPIDVEWTGFPVVLMRAGVIEKANESARKRLQLILERLRMDDLGEKENPNLRRLAFAPIFAPASLFGFSGEDVGFSVNVKDAGGKILVDSRVFVEHLKLRPIRPIQQVCDTPIEGEPIRNPVDSSSERVEENGGGRSHNSIKGKSALEYTGV